MSSLSLAHDQVSVDGSSHPSSSADAAAIADENDLHHIKNTLCPSCSGSKAQTKILPTNIPYFRQIIILSVECPDCHFCDSQVDFGSVESKGKKITLTITNWEEERNRQIAKSDTATVYIAALDLELPPKTQVGVNTIEGMLAKAANNLESLQEERLRMGDLSNFHRCHCAITKLRSILGSRDNHDDDYVSISREDEELTPFTIMIDDPAGNSFIENPCAPHPDPNMTCENYNRTPTQDISLGLQPSKEAVETGVIDDCSAVHKKKSQRRHRFDIEEDCLHDITTQKEVMKFPTPCPHCQAPSETNMCVTNIPHFKEVVLMCFQCEQCGYRSNEIKGGGAIPKLGTKITLHVKDMQDLKREVLKSDTAGVSVPEIELDLEEGGLDGMYTTVEGLLLKMHDRLRDANPFGIGDSSIKHHAGNDGEAFSAPRQEHVKYIEFLTRLKDMAGGQTFPFIFIITDPLSNSFVGNLSRCEVFNDEGLDIEEFERSEDQNERLGLSDIKTENYSTKLQKH